MANCIVFSWSDEQKKFVNESAWIKCHINCLTRTNKHSPKNIPLRKSLIQINSSAMQENIRL